MNTTTCKTVDGAYLDAFGAAHCPGWNDRPTRKLLAQAAVDLAQAADDAGHSLSVVGFNEEDDEEQTPFLQSLVVGDGIYLATTEADELPGLLVSVCETL